MAPEHRLAAFGAEEHGPDQVVALEQVARPGPRSGPSPCPGRWPGRRSTGPRSATARRSPSSGPALFSRSTMARSRSTTTGARPSDSSSMSRMSGSWSSTRARASICCWPPESSAGDLVVWGVELGEQLETRSAAAPAVSGPDSSEQPGADGQVLGDGQAGEHPLAAGQLDDPEPGPGLGRHVGDVLAVEADHPALGDLEPADHPQDGGLPGAVGAEQGERLAPLHLEVRRRTAPGRGRRRSRCRPAGGRRHGRATLVGRLRCSSCSSSSSETTRERSWRMKRAPFMSSSPPMMLVGTPRTMTVSRMPMALVKKPAMIPPAGTHR